MFSRMFYTALLAGLISGLFVTAAQNLRQIPLIHLAETYEAAEPAHDHGAANSAHTHEAEAWEPEDGLERTAFTALANVLAGIGYALVLVAAFALFGVTDVKSGVFWGLGGYAAFVLAPSFGLPPELPGSVAPDLFLRQVWWIATAAATAGGLLLIVFSARTWIKALGALLIAAPHLIRLPHPDGHGLVPPELAAQFVTAALVTNLLFWLALGMASAVMYRRFVQPPSKVAA